MNTAARSAMPTMGTKLHLPAIDSVLPVACHPDNDAVEARLSVDDRSYAVALLGSEAAADRYAETRIPTWGGLCYPNAARDRFYSIARMMNVATLMDDCFGTPAVRAEQSLAIAARDAFLAAVDGTRPGDEFPIAQLLFDTLPPVMAEIAPRVGQRLLDCIRQQAVTSGEQYARRIDSLDLPRYLRIRRIDVFGDWITTLTEYALGTDLTDELACTPSLIAARNHCIDNVTLINDYYSFPKEISAGDPFSSLWILLRDQPDLQSAIDRLAELCGQCELDFLAARDEAQEDLPGRDDVRRYLVELGHMMSGNTQFHLWSTRYQGQGFTWDGTQPQETVIRPFTPYDQGGTATR